MGADLDSARETLLAELREHALVIGEVTLSSGTAEYYVDAKRALLRPPAFGPPASWSPEAAERGRRQSGDDDGRRSPRLCRDRSRAWGRPDRLLRPQGAQGAWAAALDRRPVLEPGTRCLVVEDVVTTGGSTIRAIERIREEGLGVAGVTAVVDRQRVEGRRSRRPRELPTGRCSRSTSSTRTGRTDERARKRDPIRGGYLPTSTCGSTASGSSGRAVIV